MKGTKWSANVWIWNRKSPDKSEAKDLPPTKEDDSMAVSFVNTRSHPVEVYWDSDVSGATMTLDLKELRELFRDDKRHRRFQKQIVVPPKRELELTSYESHVFVAVDVDSDEVIWKGQVESKGQMFEI